MKQKGGKKLLEKNKYVETTYSFNKSLTISLARLENFKKDSGCLEIAFEICWRILTLEPPWLIILLSRFEATGRKSTYNSVERAMRKNSDMTDP